MRDYKHAEDRVAFRLIQSGWSVIRLRRPSIADLLARRGRRLMVVRVPKRRRVKGERAKLLRVARAVGATSALVAWAERNGPLDVSERLRVR